MSIQSDRWKRETPTPACATQLQSARTLVLGKPCRNEMISGFNTNSQNSRIKLIKKIILPPRIAFGTKFICNLLTGTKFIELTATSSGTEFMEDLQLEQSSWRIFYWNKVLKTSSFFRNKFLRYSCNEASKWIREPGYRTTYRTNLMTSPRRCFSWTRQTQLPHRTHYRVRTRLAGHQKWIDTRITYRIDVSVMKDTTTCTRGESETFAEYRSPEGKSTRGDTRKQSHGRCHNHARIARKYAKL